MMLSSSTVLASLGTLALALLPGGLCAEDWPEFRGPQGNGISTATGLPTKWNQTTNIVWKAELPGRAWSSPIVIGETIYLTNAVGEKSSTDLHDTYSLRVLALHAKDGSVIWDREVFRVEHPHAPGIHGKNSYASPTPIYRDGRLYAHFGHFGTACLDAQGKILWSTQELSYKPVHGGGGCPVLVGDHLIFSADAGDSPFIAALHASSGKLAWKQPRVSDAKRTFSFSTPLVITVQGRTQVITPGSNVVAALDPKDGSEIWRVRYEGYSVVPRPVYAQGLLFLSTGYDKATALAIRPDGQGDVTDTHVAWTLSKGAPLTPSMLVVGEDLYMVADNGMVSCVKSQTGDVLWQERVARASSASPIYADGKIYLLDEMGTGYVIKPGPKLELLATNVLDDKALASYAIAGQHLLVRTQNALWCVGQESP